MIELDLGEEAGKGVSEPPRSPVTSPPAREGSRAPPRQGRVPAPSLSVASQEPESPLLLSSALTFHTSPSSLSPFCSHSRIFSFYPVTTLLV